MAINKLNKTVVSGERARATDYNLVTNKVDELVDGVNANTTSLANKADLNHTHSENDITGLADDLAKKAPLASPALTGTPTTPTAKVNDNSTTIANTAYVDRAVAGGTGAASGVISHIEGTYATEDTDNVYLKLVNSNNYQFPSAFPVLIALKNSSNANAVELDLTASSNMVTIARSTLTQYLSDWTVAEFYGKIVESKPLHYLYTYEQDDDGNTTITPAISVNRYGNSRTLTIVPSWGYYISSMHTRKSGDKTLTEVTSTTITQPNYDIDFIAFMDILDSATVDVELGSGMSVNGEITDGNGHYIQVSAGHSETGYVGYKLSLAYVGGESIVITKPDGSIETVSSTTLSDYVLEDAGSYTFVCIGSTGTITLDFSKCLRADKFTVKNQTTNKEASVSSSVPSNTLAVTIGDILVFSCTPASGYTSVTPTYYLGTTIGYGRSTHTVVASDIGLTASVMVG